jgi:hypothetical protein
MFTRVCLSLTLLVAVPGSSQVDMSLIDPDLVRMQTPPPVNGEAYPMVVASEARSNYVRAGLTVNTTYSDNVLANYDTSPVSDTSYSVFPTITIDKVTSRLHWNSNYSPGFIIYQHTSDLDATNQSADLNVSFRVSPHVTASLRESFRKTTDTLNQPDALSSGGVSASGQPTSVPILYLIADQLTNTANGALTYQFSRDSMIGAGGTFTNLDYPHPTEAAGLYDSSSHFGSTFYTHRFREKQYVGVSYEYSEVVSSSTSTESQAQTQGFLPFYTVYFKPTLSFSLSGGLQHVTITQSPLPPYRSWSPALIVSMGWHTRRLSLAASGSRLITSGSGLIGAYHSETAAASARWQLARAWNVGSTAGYMATNNVAPFARLVSPGGHTLSGSASVQHSISEHFLMELGYTRLRQSYSNIAVIANAPNTNRAFVSVSYQFARSLGR